MAEIYSVPTVAKDLLRGLLTVIFLGFCTFGILLVVVVFLIFTDNFVIKAVSVKTVTVG